MTPNEGVSLSALQEGRPANLLCDGCRQKDLGSEMQPTQALSLEF